uniref:Peptidase_M1_N domain-containing protein n=1 Tax=Angiostrongylus cantonensis TaxID=6313 RepID=A0A158PA66_ANGCA
MPSMVSTYEAKRPLVLTAVLLAMIFVFIYILITFPRLFLNSSSSLLQSQPPPSTIPTRSSPKQNVLPHGDDFPYRFANQPFHRRHIPNIIQPYLYQVQLKLFLPWRPGVSFGPLDFTLDGLTSMHFTVRQFTKRIQLHVKQLNITSLRLYHGTAQLHIEDVSEEHPQLLDIFSSSDLCPGHNYTLILEFRTKINSQKFAGIFSAPYRHGPENRFKAATHLQPQEARSLFPCIDSPEAKARFDATVTHPEGTYALFNTKEANITTKGPISSGWTTTTFLRSPIMSTYLFSMVVSTMPYKETYTKSGVRVSIPMSIRLYFSHTIIEYLF